MLINLLCLTLSVPRAVEALKYLVPLDNPVTSCEVSLSSPVFLTVALQRCLTHASYRELSWTLHPVTLPAAFSPAGVHHNQTCSMGIKQRENHLHQRNCHFLIKLLTQQIHQVIYFPKVAENVFLSRNLD